MTDNTCKTTETKPPTRGNIPIAHRQNNTGGQWVRLDDVVAWLVGLAPDGEGPAEVTPQSLTMPQVLALADRFEADFAAPKESGTPSRRPALRREGRTMTDFRLFIAIVRDLALIAFAVAYIIHTL